MKRLRGCELRAPAVGAPGALSAGHAGRSPARRRGVLALALLLAACGGETAPSSAPAADSAAATPARVERPNVLLIVADDMTPHLGTYGHAKMVTPHLDRLAARGLRFDRAYCQTPLCNPSRASFLSGRTAASTGVYDNAVSPRVIAPDLVLLPSLFKSGGYRTLRVGKLLHFDEAQAFDEVGSPLSVVPDAPLPRLERHRLQREARRALKKQGIALPPGVQPSIDRLMVQELSEAQALWLEDSRVAELAVRFLESATVRQPFFMAVGFTSPHPDFVAPASAFQPYALGEMPVASTPAGDLDDVPPAALTYARQHPEFDDAKQRALLRGYFASLTFMDRQVGRVLDALDRSGLAGRTVVVFVSDHGQHLGEHGGLWAKLTLFEESLRVPLLVAGPGVPAASSPCAVELLDLYPTLAGLAGLVPPPGLEGRDLSPLFVRPERCAGLAGGDRGALSEIRLTARPGSGQPDRMARSLVTERYRYTEWGSPEEAELYDHATDPGEHRNLARDPEHRDQVEGQRKLVAARLAAIEEARQTGPDPP